MKPPSPLLLRALRRAAQVSAHPFPQARLHPHGLLRARLLVRPSSSRSTSSKPVSTPTAKSYQARPSPETGARSSAPVSMDRGPGSSETTQTDFAALNVLGSAAPPSTAIEMCHLDGFQLDNGIEIRGGAGCLLVHGEAFAWRPWEAPAEGARAREGRAAGDSPMGAMLNAKGQFEVPEEALGLLECVWPKPELLILGHGASVYPLAPATKQRINALGIRVDVADTRNAAAQFNLLATERGVGTIAAALVPVGWRGR